jgi:hypothetical protein
MDAMGVHRLAKNLHLVSVRLPRRSGGSRPSVTETVRGAESSAGYSVSLVASGRSINAAQSQRSTVTSRSMNPHTSTSSTPLTTQRCLRGMPSRYAAYSGCFVRSMSAAMKRFFTASAMTRSTSTSRTARSSSRRPK